jgi:hypothetical protein
MILETAMQPHLDADSISDLLQAAEDADPYSDFVEGVRDWYEIHGFITPRQVEALQRITDRRR